jgi:hypothetical protein
MSLDGCLWGNGLSQFDPKATDDDFMANGGLLIIKLPKGQRARSFNIGIRSYQRKSTEFRALSY